MALRIQHLHQNWINYHRKERILILWLGHKTAVMHIRLLQRHHKNHSNSTTEEEKIPGSVHTEKWMANYLWETRYMCMHGWISHWLRAGKLSNTTCRKYCKCIWLFFIYKCTQLVCNVTKIRPGIKYTKFIITFIIQQWVILNTMELQSGSYILTQCNSIHTEKIQHSLGWTTHICYYTSVNHSQWALIELVWMHYYQFTFFNRS
jgi:hypothetical protein